MFEIRMPRKGLYKEFSILVIPIIIQNLISASVSSADVVMLGMVGKTELSAASLAGQLQFILLIINFGIGSGLTVLASQYWGKRDTKTLSKIMGIGFIVAFFIAAGFFIAAFFFSEGVMRIFVGENEELIALGESYLRFVSFSYLFMSISQVYLTMLKSMERVKFSSAVSIFTLFVNISLNAVLIFGLFGAPKLGVAGAALATSIARGIEIFICFIDSRRQRVLPVGLRDIFSIKKVLVFDFVRYSLPALINDVMWVLAYSFYSVIMGHIGSDMVAANSVVGVPMGLVSTVGFAIAGGSSILLGKELGQNRIEEAKRDADSIFLFTFLLTVAGAVVMILAKPIIMYFAGRMNDITPTALDYLNQMIYINAVYQMGQVINTLLIASFFRAGGDSRFGMIIDIITMWCFAVPVGYLAAFVFKLPPMTVYIIMKLDEFVKMPVEFRHYKNKKWLKNLTRPMA